MQLSKIFYRIFSLRYGVSLLKFNMKIKFHQQRKVKAQKMSFYNKLKALAQIFLQSL